MHVSERDVRPEPRYRFGPYCREAWIPSNEFLSVCLRYLGKGDEEAKFPKIPEDSRDLVLLP